MKRKTAGKEPAARPSDKTDSAVATSTSTSVRHQSSPSLSPIAEVLPATEALPARKSHAEQRQDEIREIEDELLRKSLEIVDASLDFCKVDPTIETPPEQWVRELGADKAERKFKVAKAAWMAPKDAPCGILMAKSVSLGIIKARAAEGTAPRGLNIAVQMVVSAPHFPELEVE